MATGRRRGGRGWWRWVGLAAALGLTATGCITVSSAGSTGPGGEGTGTGAFPVTTVFVQRFRYHGLPRTLKTGVHAFLFENRESFSITHEMIPVALPGGKTAADITADAKAKGPNSEDDWLHVGGDFGTADTGASNINIVYLPPGKYAVACWQTGTPTGGTNGPPHAAIGMVGQFTVTP